MILRRSTRVSKSCAVSVSAPRCEPHAPAAPLLHQRHPPSATGPPVSSWPGPLAVRRKHGCTIPPSVNRHFARVIAGSAGLVAVWRLVEVNLRLHASVARIVEDRPHRSAICYHVDPRVRLRRRMAPEGPSNQLSRNARSTAPCVFRQQGNSSTSAIHRLRCE